MFNHATRKAAHTCELKVVLSFCFKMFNHATRKAAHTTRFTHKPAINEADWTAVTTQQFWQNICRKRVVKLDLKLND